MRLLFLCYVFETNPRHSWLFFIKIETNDRTDSEIFLKTNINWVLDGLAYLQASAVVLRLYELATPKTDAYFPEEQKIKVRRNRRVITCHRVGGVVNILLWRWCRAAAKSVSLRIRATGTASVWKFVRLGAIVDGINIDGPLNATQRRANVQCDEGMVHFGCYFNKFDKNLIVIVTNKKI